MKIFSIFLLKCHFSYFVSQSFDYASDLQGSVELPGDILNFQSPRHTQTN